MLEIINPGVIGVVVAVAILFGILLCLTLGRWIGRRATVGYGAAGMPSTSSLEAAVFALLGLLIAFTVSGALQLSDLRSAHAMEWEVTNGTAGQGIDLST